MNVREIVAAWLAANGYDGLFQDGECACKCADLMPCSGDFSTCDPGVLCDPPDDADVDPDIGWYIGPKVAA